MGAGVGYGAVPHTVKLVDQLMVHKETVNNEGDDHIYQKNRPPVLRFPDEAVALFFAELYKRRIFFGHGVHSAAPLCVTAVKYNDDVGVKSPR